jgi:hypothetical protein
MAASSTAYSPRADFHTRAGVRCRSASSAFCACFAEQCLALQRLHQLLGEGSARERDHETILFYPEEDNFSDSR